MIADVLPIPARMPNGAQAPAPIAGAASHADVTIDYGAAPPHSRDYLSMDLSRLMDLVDAEARMEERMVAFEHEVIEKAGSWCPVCHCDLRDQHGPGCGTAVAG